MNQPEKHLTYLQGRSSDGTRVLFPISKHVLRLNAARGAPIVQRVKKWRPSLLQQSSALVLMMTLCASSYGVTYGEIHSTLAYFRDEEVSRNNVLAAGALDFRVNPGDSTDIIVEQGSVFILPLMKTEANTFPTMYRVKAEEIGGPTPLCALLDATATSSPFLYNGPLVSLETNATTTTGHWNLQISLPSAEGLSDGDKCTVHFVYHGWHKDVPEGTGYTDEERDSFTFVFSGKSIVEEAVLLAPAPAPDLTPENEQATTTESSNEEGGEVLGTSTSTDPVTEPEPPAEEKTENAPPPSQPAGNASQDNGETKNAETPPADVPAEEPIADQPADTPSGTPADNPGPETTQSTEPEAPVDSPPPPPAVAPPPPAEPPPPSPATE